MSFEIFMVVKGGLWFLGYDAMWSSCRWLDLLDKYMLEHHLLIANLS
jgi:hypothetical protein